MFSYILVISRGYILLISICPMLNFGKLSIKASYILAILFKNYFKGAKIWWLLLNCTKTPLIVLCWKSWQSTLWVDFKLESVLLKARRKKIFFYNSLRNGSNYNWLSITQNPKKDEAIIWITHELVQDNDSLSFWMWFLYRFCSEGTSEIVWFL